MSALEFEILTLFPGLVDAFVAEGLVGRAVRDGHIAVRATDIREFTDDRHRTVDDTPFGGGPGMVMKAEPIVRAIEAVERTRGPAHKILLTPAAATFDQAKAVELAGRGRVLLVCGRYEGVDDRVREHFVDECLSIGDFVLNGGEVAALAVVEAVARLREGVLGNHESLVHESFGTGLLEHPHYTRPAEFRGFHVPEVLRGGDHDAIARHRRIAAFRRTWAVRPDLRARPVVAPGHPMAFLAGPDADPRETSRRLRKAWRKQVAVLAVSPPTDEDALAFSVALDFLDVPLPGLLFVPAPALSHDAAALRVAVPGLPLANPPGLIDISQPSARPVVHAGARAVLAALTAEGLLP